MTTFYTDPIGQTTVPVSFLAVGTGAINLASPSGSMNTQVPFVVSTSGGGGAIGSTTVNTQTMTLGPLPQAVGVGVTVTLGAGAPAGVIIQAQPAPTNSSGVSSFNLQGPPGSVVPLTYSWTSCGQVYTRTDNVTLV